MTKIPHCVRVYRAELTGPYGHGGKPRAQKKFFKKTGIDDPVHTAHGEGEFDSYTNHPYRNRYPRGKRHDAYRNGYNTDWMGIHHGENV